MGLSLLKAFIKDEPLLLESGQRRTGSICLPNTKELNPRHKLHVRAGAEVRQITGTLAKIGTRGLLHINGL